MDASGLGALASFSLEMFRRFGVEADLRAEVSAKAIALLDHAIHEGFSEALMMPSAEWQHDHTMDLAAAFATGDSGESPYIEVAGLVPLGRPDGPYLLLLRSDPRTDDDLRGLTAPALRRKLGQESSLTVTEYLVCQRALFERDGDRQFDDYAAEPSGWMWLAGSSDGERTAMAYWNGSRRRVEVTSCRTGSRNLRKGARRVRIIPLDPPS